MEFYRIKLIRLSNGEMLSGKTAKLVKRPVMAFASLAQQMSGTRPKHQTTWNDYQERILRVLTHIQEHLDEALDLEELARVACFSSFHFHRVFAAMTGETIADHVRRLRLERAAMELRSGAKQVIQVALDAGYEAHEAFTRAFKSAYGVSPAEFRRATGPIAILAAPSGVHFRPGVPLTTFNTNHITTKFMKVITKKIKPMRVAYLRHVGPYEDTKQTWFDLMARLSADKQIRKRSVFIGMGHDNPSVTPAAELRYDACITVDEEYEPKKPVELQTIVGGDYAVAKNCPVGKIKDAFQYLYRQMARAEFPGVAAGAELYGVCGCPGQGRARETAGGYLYAVAAEAAPE